MHEKPLSLGESIFQAWFVFTALGCYVALSVWFIDRDMRKLAREANVAGGGGRLLRAYGTTSFAAAVFCGTLLGFPQIAVLVHFIRTRRSASGVLLGLFWSALTFVPVLAFATIVDLVFPD